MALQNGSLVVVRLRLTLPPGQTEIDTGVRMVRQAFAPDPPLGGSQAQQLASRVMVHPLPPLPAWTAIQHEEPFIDPATGTVHVVFHNFGDEVELVVMVDGVHTLTGPVSAEPYGEVAPPPQQVQFVTPEMSASARIDAT